MDDDFSNLPPLKTLRQHIWQGLRRAQTQRPVSFYLLLSIPLVLVLGLELARAHDNPRKFFLFLALLFTFFFVLLSRALVDFIEITRKRLAEEKEIFRSTLGEEQFLAGLKKKVEDETTGG